MLKYTRHIAPKQYKAIAYVTLKGKNGLPLGEQLKNIVVTERSHLGLTLSTEEIFIQDTYKSTLGLDARKSELRGKATRLYDGIKIDLEVEAKKSAYRTQKNQNQIEKSARMQLQSEGLTKNQLRKLNKIKKQSAK